MVGKLFLKMLGSWGTSKIFLSEDILCKKRLRNIAII
jgi:hypothetical protein